VRSLALESVCFFARAHATRIPFCKLRSGRSRAAGDCSLSMLRMRRSRSRVFYGRPPWRLTCHACHASVASTRAARAPQAAHRRSNRARPSPASVNSFSGRAWWASKLGRRTYCTSCGSSRALHHIARAGYHCARSVARAAARLLPHCYQTIPNDADLRRTPSIPGVEIFYLYIGVILGGDTLVITLNQRVWRSKPMNRL